MMETVKTVNGYAITRYAGTKSNYYINIKDGRGWAEFHCFKTIKAATAFAESMPARK